MELIEVLAYVFWVPIIAIISLFTGIMIVLSILFIIGGAYSKIFTWREQRKIDSKQETGSPA